MSCLGRIRGKPSLPMNIFYHDRIMALRTFVICLWLYNSLFVRQCNTWTTLLYWLCVHVQTVHAYGFIFCRTATWALTIHTVKARSKLFSAAFFSLDVARLYPRVLRKALIHWRWKFVYWNFCLTSQSQDVPPVPVLLFHHWLIHWAPS